MTHKRNSFLVLILTSLIPLLGLTQGLPSKDTSSRNYTWSEMNKIAETLINGKQCDTLLSTCVITGLKKDSIITNRDKAISLKDKQLSLQDRALSEQDTVIDIQRGWLKKAGRQLKWLKAGWASSTLGLILLVVIVIIKS